MDYSRARAYCACCRCGWGLFGQFYSHLSFLSSLWETARYRLKYCLPSLWETARYRLKYCLKGPLNPKQPTNHLSHKDGWSGSAMVLGKLPVPGRPTYLEYSTASTFSACSSCGWGLFGHFCSRLSFPFSFSLCLGDGPI